MGQGRASKGRVKKTGAMATNNLGELGKYMNDTYGMYYDENSLQKVDFDVARNLSSAIEDMLHEFPGIKGSDISLNGKMRGTLAYAGTTVDGRIMLQPSIFGSVESIESQYAKDIESEYHPEGTTYVNTVIHEMGHQIEAAILRRQIPGKDRKAVSARASSWKNGTVAKDIVERAMDNVIPRWRQNKKLAEEHINKISRYAAVDASETVAEAISDYYSNRSKAAPLSKEIWKIAKQELG